MLKVATSRAIAGEHEQERVEEPEEVALDDVALLLGVSSAPVIASAPSGRHAATRSAQLVLAHAGLGGDQHASRSRRLAQQQSLGGRRA